MSILLMLLFLSWKNSGVVSGQMLEDFDYRTDFMDMFGLNALQPEPRTNEDYSEKKRKVKDNIIQKDTYKIKGRNLKKSIHGKTIGSKHQRYHHKREYGIYPPPTNYEFRVEKSPRSFIDKTPQYHTITVNLLKK